MALSFSETSEHYIVTETLHGWTDTKITIVKYTKDLMMCACNNEPMRPTTKEARDWFRKYHMKHFKS